eukprot:TRINITY_DN4833_c0_g1_i1.p1 TRINITY_DN4833_c0_g1~~TRINITY_DN4833_c0_g1_i1.p1  ORF type:complete len:836 (-),score=198.17 TRINITY_DN4833_c0_g1_i1:84-2591(-)
MSHKRKESDSLENGGEKERDKRSHESAFENDDSGTLINEKSMVYLDESSNNEDSQFAEDRPLKRPLHSIPSIETNTSRVPTPPVHPTILSATTSTPNSPSLLLQENATDSHTPQTPTPLMTNISNNNNNNNISHSTIIPPPHTSSPISKYDYRDDTSTPSTPSTSFCPDEETPTGSLPTERIIFCIDLDREIDFLFKKGPRLDHIKKAIRMFVRVKLLDQKQTQFAIMVLRLSSYWVQDFTSDYNTIKDKLNQLSRMEESLSEFDMTTLFDLVESKFANVSRSNNNNISNNNSINNSNNNFNNTSSTTNNNANDGEDKKGASTQNTKSQPQYCNRVILFYSRTSTQPKYLGGKQSLERLLSSPNFHYDGVYMYHGYIQNQADIFAALTPSQRCQVHKVADASSIRKFYYCVLGLLYIHPQVRPTSPKYLRFPVGLINYWMCTLFGISPSDNNTATLGNNGPLPLNNNGNGPQVGAAPNNLANPNNPNPPINNILGQGAGPANNNLGGLPNVVNNNINNNIKHNMSKLPGLCVPPIPPPPPPPPPNSLGYDLKYYLNNWESCDVVFHVGGSVGSSGGSPHRIPGHKIILCARSPYFRALLTNGMKESQSGLSAQQNGSACLEIPLPNIDPHLFLMMLSFLYTGNVPTSMFNQSSTNTNANQNSNNSNSNSTQSPIVVALNLLILADQYLLEGLKHRCCLEIMQYITPSNLTWLMQLADQLTARDLRRACMWHFYNLLPDLLKDKDFMCDGIYSDGEEEIYNRYAHLISRESDVDSEVELAALVVRYFSRVAGLAAPAALGQAGQNLVDDDVVITGASKPNTEQGTLQDFQELIELF